MNHYWSTEILRTIDRLSMIKKSLLFILLCVPVLSGCKSHHHKHNRDIKHYQHTEHNHHMQHQQHIDATHHPHIGHHNHEHTKAERAHSRTSHVLHFEPLATPYQGPLSSIDCPKEGHHHAKHKRHMKH